MWPGRPEAALVSVATVVRADGEDLCRPRRRRPEFVQAERHGIVGTGRAGPFTEFVPALIYGLRIRTEAARAGLFHVDRPLVRDQDQTI